MGVTNYLLTGMILQVLFHQSGPRLNKHNEISLHVLRVYVLRVNGHFLGFAAVFGDFWHDKTFVNSQV